MAKGVKKIKWTGQGKVISNLSVPNKKAAISPSEYVFFEVDQWYDGTPETDKKKNITWIFQDYKARTIILQKTLPINRAYGIKLPKNLCGQYEYYLEASLSGKRDLINQTGLKISGYCPPRIESSKWCTTNDGDDIRQSHIFSYGEITYLNLVTEGLNGHKNLRIDIFRHLDLKTDKLLRSIAGVEVIDGEINLEISNTYSWYFDVKNPIAKELFYVKVYDPVSKTYIVDDKNDTAHARFLRMKRDVVSQQIKPPTNLSALKTGEPAKNAERFDLCKFEKITIIEDNEEGGKKTETLIFNNGVNLKGLTLKKEPLKKTILFEFDSHAITSDAKTILNNTLQFLLEHQFSSIKIDGHACVIGKEQYNQKLSQQRSDVVKKLFVDGGLESSRIISTGRGEVNPTDDKKGRDNIKYKDEKEYKENRCVDISFDYFGHDANTIVYETIAPSHDKNITIDITEYQNKACLTGTHKANIKISSPEYKTIDRVASKLDFPVKSNISAFNIAPLQYMWLKLIANEYLIDVHSCRYFSNDKNTTVKVMAYPDIKWDFHFFLNLSNELSVKWGNLPPGKDKEMRKKAGKIGAEKRWKQTDIDFGVVLEANWDKIGEDKYGSHFDATLKYEEKIKQLYSVFSSLKEFSKGVTGGTKGVVKNTNQRYDIQMKPPNFCLGAIWQLAKGTKNKIPTNELGIEYNFYFKAEPLIALVLTIDLLDLAAQVGGTLVGGPAGNQSAQLILDIIRVWAAEEKEQGITFKLLFDLILTGQIDGSADITINTASDDNKGKAELKTKLSAEIKLEVELKAKAVLLEVTAYAAGTAKASAKASATFGHSLNYNQNSKSLHYRPEMKFDAVDGKVLIKIEAGLSAKKLNLDFKEDKTIVNEDFHFWDGFDVIKQLEKTTGYNASIQLL